MALGADKQAEIDSLRDVMAPTRRATVEALEAMLYDPVPVLDHGFIRLIDYMGDDAAIVQAARVSYGRGTKQISGDRGLINYLMRHRHTSPFEMCELKLHVKLPIFVARQWIRHRTANVNEYSARYSVLDREFYIPDKDLLKLVKAARKEEPVQERLFALPGAEHTATQSATNKQGRDEVLAAETAAGVLRGDRWHQQPQLHRVREAARRRRATRDRARTRSHGPATEHLHAVVLEGRPPQPAALPSACATTATPSTRSGLMPRCSWTWCANGCR